MIDNYLFGLIDNCHVLSRDTANVSVVKESIRNDIEQVMVNYGITDRTELVSVLTDSSSKKCKEIIDSSSLCKMFFLVNSFSEYNRDTECFDSLGRFKYEYSFQSGSEITTNEVLQLILELVEKKFKAVYKTNFHNSYFFLSHDIDSLYGSFVQDGAWAIKKGRFDVLLRLFTDVVTLKPHWFNIDKIMRLESEYDFKSTFYWLVNSGKIDQRQTNSDYNINSKPVKAAIKQVCEQKFENGLHKSISNESIETEMKKMPVKVSGNRYHYLKFALPVAYTEIEKSGLKLDASLGFAEHFGFRNSYGYPFHPYNIHSGTRFTFLEVPLTIMDGTFQRYMKVPVNKTAGTIIKFLDQNSKNCLHSILWHNTFFTDYKYKGYLEEYKKILQYLYDNRFRNINQSEILETFSWRTT
jgi:hypothetical protein